VPHLMLAVDVLGAVMVAVGFGGLIFIHELGHYLACRVTGTRVEAFSIGFGPKLFGWRRGHTVYKLSLIPLGGYVKMAAENPGERGTGAPDEFPNKSFSQRLFIMSAGVLFNLILAFLLFAWAFGIGVPTPKAQIGYVVRGGPAWEAGLLPGDTVTHVDGQEILGFTDLVAEVALSDEGPVTLTVVRDGKTLELEVTPEKRRGQPDLAITNAWDFAARVAPDSPVALAGGQPREITGSPTRIVR